MTLSLENNAVIILHIYAIPLVPMYSLPECYYYGQMAKVARYGQRGQKHLQNKIVVECQEEKTFFVVGLG